MAKAAAMRNRVLHQSLRDFAEQASFQLEADATGGAEIPFEVVESPGANAPLYCYRPLTADFIRDRLGVLGVLPTYASARRALEGLGGVDAYLRVRGEPRIPEDPGERADAALRSLLSSMFAEASEFEFSAPRFSRAYAELESAVYESRTLIGVLVPVHGLEIASDEVPLAEGLTLARGDTVTDAPREAVWSKPVPSPEPNVLAVLTAEGVPGDPPPLAEARERFRALLTALRLVDAAGFALGSSAWARADAGPFQLAALGIGGGVPGARRTGRGGGGGRAARLLQPRGPPRRAPASSRGRCAASRWVASASTVRGVDRPSARPPRAAEPEGPGSGRLAERLAAICATPERAGGAGGAHGARHLARTRVIAGVRPPGRLRGARRRLVRPSASRCCATCSAATSTPTWWPSPTASSRTPSRAIATRSHSSRPSRTSLSRPTPSPSRSSRRWPSRPTPSSSTSSSSRPRSR